MRARRVVCTVDSLLGCSSLRFVASQFLAPCLYVLCCILIIWHSTLDVTFSGCGDSFVIRQFIRIGEARAMYCRSFFPLLGFSPLRFSRPTSGAENLPPFSQHTPLISYT